MKTEKLLFYKDSKDINLLKNMDLLIAKVEENADKKECEGIYYSVVSDLYEYASENGFKGNLWHCYLTELLVYNENPYSIACEKRGDVEGTLSEAVKNDFSIYMDFFRTDFEKIMSYVGSRSIEMAFDYKPSQKEAIKYNKRIVGEINALAENLAKAADVDAFKNLLDVFYKNFGVGVFGLHKAFRVEGKEDELVIKPIYNIAITSLDDLVGYDTAKQKLVDNTEAFLHGKKANNCLLFGDAGTGKSSSIRAILNQYYDDGLRMIEVYKHQYQELNTLIDRLKIRNYKFIIYMDDLSFEEFETEYKYLKAVIEGGLESKPDNVLIYATSNRRHLVRETTTDRDTAEDMHKNETVQEKLSLFARFGVSIYFGAPDKMEFNNIVLELAHRYSIPMTDDEILAEANKWEVYHGGRSGRVARQFINDLRHKAE